MTGVSELIKAVNNPHSEVQVLGLSGIPINRTIAYIAERLSNEREFTVTHGGIIDTEDVVGKKIGR